MVPGLLELTRILRRGPRSVNEGYREVAAPWSFRRDATRGPASRGPAWQTRREGDSMAQIVHERIIALQDNQGRRYDLARTLAEEQPDGTWHGSIEFRSAEGHVLNTERETTQSNIA